MNGKGYFNLMSVDMNGLSVGGCLFGMVNLGGFSPFGT